MNREQLVEAILDNKELWSCPLSGECPTIETEVIGQCRRCASNLLSKYEDEIIKEYDNKIRKGGTIVWHDLRKDPTDLPDKLGFYIGCVEHPSKHTRVTKEIQLYNIYKENGLVIPEWRRNNTHAYIIKPSSVIAWAEYISYED